MKREITIESVLEDKVMLRAVNQISGKSNHGGFNGMYPRELREYWARHGTFIKNQIRTCSKDISLSSQVVTRKERSESTQLWIKLYLLL